MAEKNQKKSLEKILHELAKERQQSGCTLSDKEIAFLVKVCEQCAG